MFHIPSLLSESKNELESNSRNSLDRNRGDSNRKPGVEPVNDSVRQQQLKTEPEQKQETVTEKVASSDTTVKDDKNARSTDANTPTNNH